MAGEKSELEKQMEALMAGTAGVLEGAKTTQKTAAKARRVASSPLLLRYDLSGMHTPQKSAPRCIGVSISVLISQIFLIYWINPCLRY